MADSLKSANKLPLFGVMAANFAVFYTALKGGALLGADWHALARGAAEALPGGIGLVLVGILNAQLSPDAKARIVFWRWRNPLPGSEAFTRHAHGDPRVDLAVIERAHGPLPTEPRAQNALWYRLYKSVDSDPSVQQVHREFLFARDYACLALMMLVVLGTAGFVQFPSVPTALGYVGLLAVQCALALRAARNHGERFVTTVLALKGAGR